MIRILFAKTQRTCSLMPSVFINVSIVFAGGIDVLMTEYVRYEIDITGFFIQFCTVGTTKLMWCYFL